MQLKNIVAPILLSMIITGCGGGGDPQLTAVSKQAASQDCISCHAEELSPGTGKSIISEWQASTHNTKNGAGCTDCHEPALGHPNLCSSCHGGAGTPAGYEVTWNPDAAGKCGKCHGYLLPNDIMMTLSPQHFGNMTASAANTRNRASYVTSRYVGHCNYCHNPHDTSSAMPQARQWANSLLSTKGTAFNKLQGTTVPASQIQGQSFCVRCHTTTGFINFVSVDASGLRFNDLHAWTPAGDKTVEVIGCDACHDNGRGSSYSYAVRNVPAVSLYYNYSANTTQPLKISGSPTLFPDFGRSNVCVPCHAGRYDIGNTIKKIEALGLDFTNAPALQGGHNRLAPLTISQNGYYEFPGLNYENPGYLHRSVGVGNSRGTGNSGPCVTCHIANGGGHLFYPVSFSSPGKIISEITSKTCVKCHDGSFQPTWTPETLQAKRNGYASSLAILGLLRNYSSSTKVPGTAKYPKGTTNGKTNANPDWTVFAPGAPHAGANTMGAVFNYSQIVADPAGFVHNSLYVRRLIYDSIDWLHDGVLGNNDVEKAIEGATLAPSTAAKTLYYVSLSYQLPGGTAFITSQPPSADTTLAFRKVKTDAINWLLGGTGRGRP